MITNLKFSVVTISFNQSKYLKECIESVLNQGYPDFEYIVVDAGSTDGSREIIDSYGDRIVRIYESDDGPSDGLNKGFSCASGDIFCYLNSDDTLLHGAFKKVSSYFNDHHSVDVVCGNGYIIDGASKISRAVFSDKFNIKAVAYGSCLSIQPSTFFKKEIFKKVGGFNLNNTSNWDSELLIDMALLNANIIKINEFLSCYRVHVGSITGTGRLSKDHALHGTKMFTKIMRRQFCKNDIWMQRFYNIKKHLVNPRATLERILKGPIFGTKKC